MFLYAHPGRTDKNGGHKGPGGYHYHNGVSSSSSSKSTSGSSSSTTSDYLTKEDEIMELQTLLKYFEFYNGPINGKCDNPTIEAANIARIKYNMPGGAYFTLIRRELLFKLRELKDKK
jgi:hypothetical protein